MWEAISDLASILLTALEVIVVSFHMCDMRTSNLIGWITNINLKTCAVYYPGTQAHTLDGSDE